MRILQALSGVVLLLAASACSPVIETRGNMPQIDQLEQIRPGEHRREDIAALLGSPSSTSLFDNETWYYIASRKEFFAFYAPEEIDRMVVAIRFDDAGTVQDMRILGMEDGRRVELVRRETPTAGTEMTILQQLLGNIGRFGDAGDR